LFSDKIDDPEEKKKSEEIFREYAEGYEILSNEESRRKYDNGEDIEVQQHQQGGGFPFGGFGFPEGFGGFGGGQQQFHFRF
jgi:DnaJ family protein C protein 3